MKYKIKAGINEKQIDEFLVYTHSDPEVKKQTSDVTRFKNKSAAKKFLKKCTKVYSLVDSKNNLFGIVWFEEKQLPGYPDFPLTMGIRIYGEARGKGLAHYFMDSCFRRNDKVGVWLSTSFDNTPAVKSYIKFGFKRVSDPDAKGKIIMIRNPHGV